MKFLPRNLIDARRGVFPVDLIGGNVVRANLSRWLRILSLPTAERAQKHDHANECQPTQAAPRRDVWLNPKRDGGQDQSLVFV